MKLSQDIEKVTIPGKKNAFRLYGGDGKSYVPITYFFFYFLKMEVRITTRTSRKIIFPV